MRFRLFGIPVHVSGAFAVIALLFAAQQRDPVLFGASVLVVFVAILVHELGHALVGRAFGMRPGIVLHGMGGTTSFEGSPLPRLRNIATTLAGPFAGFALGILVVVLLRARVIPDVPVAQAIANQMLFCTFGWGVFNLVPVLPLDGGLVMRDVLGPKHRRTTLILSSIFAVLLTVVCMRFQMIWGMIIFGMSSYQSIRGAISFREVERDMIARFGAGSEAIAAAKGALEAERWEEAARRGGEAIAFAPTAELRDAARRIRAAAFVGMAQGGEAFRDLAAIERPVLADDVLRAQALDLVGERAAAFALLESGVVHEPAGPALEPLLRGLVATGRRDDALRFASTHVGDGNVGALLFLAEDALDAGRVTEARELAHALLERTGDTRFSQILDRCGA